MSFNPVGSVVLLHDIPFDNSYGHTIDFKDIEEQTNYFLTEKFHSRYDDYSYLRRERSIKIGVHVEDLQGSNYLMYQNGNGKWIYCFITRKTYINDSNTELILETDVIQTFWFDIKWGHTLIEREHCDRWKGIGSPIYSTTEEGLTLGSEYVIRGIHKIHEVTPQYIITLTQLCDKDGNQALQPSTLNGSSSTVCYGICTEEEFKQKAPTLGKCPAVISIAKLPLDVIGMGGAPVYIKTLEYPREDEYDTELNKQPLPKVGAYPINILLGYTPSRVLGHVPKFIHYPMGSLGKGIKFNASHESKLLTYPYSYGLLSDCQSTPLKVKHELVEGNTFEVTGVCSVSHSPKAKYFISSGYRGCNDGKLDCLINDKDMQLPLTSDAYKNYIMNNSTQIKTSQAVNVVNTVTGVIGGVVSGASSGALLGTKLGGVKGAVIGGAIGGLSPLFNGFTNHFQQLAKQKDLQEIPESVRSMGNNVAFDMIDHNNQVLHYFMSVDERTRNILADFWHMYGYACKEVKIPNLRSRYYYNFIKTNGCNITGNIDNHDLTRIKEIFDNGITIWHYREDVTPLDYTFDNVEVNFV